MDLRNKKERRTVLIVTVCFTVCWIWFTDHEENWLNRSEKGTAPYISQGVLPVMEQLEEDTPDFSVQQPVTNGFVNIGSSFLAPTRLILRQDGPEGEWYHILYQAARWEALAENYARRTVRAAEREGWTPQPVEGGYSWTATYEVEGREEILLLRQGAVVVQVTYHGPKNLIAKAPVWRTAFFPETP